MFRAAALLGALIFSPAAALAQQPCTSNGRQVVNEVYRHMLERAPDAASGQFAERLANGSATVREIVRDVAKSSEHMQRFGQDATRESVATLYRHILGRQPDETGLREYTATASRRGLAFVADDIIASPEYSQQFGDWGVPGSGGLRFCATGAQAQTTMLNGDVMRWSQMDRNRDGIITRAEWRGSRATFDAADWNNDGVLTGDEVREGAVRPSAGTGPMERFAHLDRNSNNQIETYEWDRDRAAFDRLDLNKDGVLTGDELPAGAPRGTRETDADSADDRLAFLDTNRNGRVERREWDGSAAAFERLDQNNDGRLTRMEIDSAPMSDRFANLDLDDDGRITMNEWNWSRRTFDEQDLNRDGALTPREFRSGAVGTSGRW